MFKPERMSLLQVVVQDADVIRACACLVKEKAIHLVDRAHVAPALREGTPAFFSSVHADLELLNGVIEQLRGWIREELGEVPRRERRGMSLIDPPRTVEELKPKVLAAQGEFERRQGRRASLQSELQRLKQISDTLQSFETAGVSYGEMCAFRHFGFVAGVMPMRSMGLLRASLRQVVYHVEVRRLDENDASVIIVAPKEQVGAVRAALRSVYFTEVTVPEEYRAEAAEAMDRLEVEMWQVREELAQVAQELRGLSEEVGEWVEEAGWRVRANLRVLEAMQLFGKTARTTCINGWVPREAVPRVVGRLRSELGGRVIVHASEPETSGGLAAEVVKRGAVRVPTKFRHPGFLKAFEGLVTTYGYPAYDGIDPTIFVAGTFLLLFGMMFGDVGQGLVLMAAGILLAKHRFFRPVRNVGWLLSATGVSASIFGLLFGSVFGLEGVIQPLWFLPMERVQTMLVVSIVVGVCILSLGLILNIVQAVQRKKYREALFGQWGVCSGTFYWLTLLVFYASVVRGARLSVWLTIAVLLLPIVMVVVGDILYQRWFEKKVGEEQGEEGEHSLAEIIFKPVEIVLSCATHTISFVRVGAFGLNHAALMMVVYILARMGGSFDGQGATFTTRASFVVFAIVGNLFVMVLEGMVVFIQCLRLEYYEFFSKFFAGDGIRYEPLQVEDA
ncbi:MAG: hypothetical protein N2595_05075 [bacterium]|nr:hypothetical protein [bacterium]